MRDLRTESERFENREFESFENCLNSGSEIKNSFYIRVSNITVTGFSHVSYFSTDSSSVDCSLNELTDLSD